MATEDQCDSSLTTSDIFDFERVDHPVSADQGSESDEGAPKMEQSSCDLSDVIQSSLGLSGDSLVFGMKGPSKTEPTDEGKTMLDIRETLDHVSEMLDDMRKSSLPGLEQRLALRLDQEKEYLRDKLVGAMRLILDKLSVTSVTTAEVKPSTCTTTVEAKPTACTAAVGTQPKQAESTMSCQYKPSTNSAQHQEIKDALMGIQDMLRDIHGGNTLLMEVSDKLGKLGEGSGHGVEEENQQLQQVLNVKQKVIDEQRKVIEDQQVVMEGKQKVVDEQNEMLKEKQKVVEEQQRLIETKQRVIEEHQKVIGQHEATIKEKQKIVEKKQKMVGEKQKLIEENQKLIVEQEKALKKKQRVIEEKQVVVDKKQKEGEAWTVAQTGDFYREQFYAAVAQVSTRLRRLSLYEAAVGVVVIILLVHLVYFMFSDPATAPPKPKPWFSFFN